MKHLSADHGCFKPSARSLAALNDVLFPYQIYLFSQAFGDTSAQRCETAILQVYLSSLCSSCVRILTRTLSLANPSNNQADVISALRDTALGQLLPYAVNMLYVGSFAMDVISYVSGDLQEILMMWCKLMKIFAIETDVHQRKDNLLFQPVFDPSFTPVPQPVSWYLTLFYLLIAISSKINFNTRYFQIVDKTPELQRLAESFLCSGGLRSGAQLAGGSLLQDVYENKANRFDALHAFLDAQIPEPAWKRRVQPVSEALELRLFAVFVYHQGCCEELRALLHSLCIEDTERAGEAEKKDEAGEAEKTGEASKTSEAEKTSEASKTSEAEKAGEARAKPAKLSPALEAAWREVLKLREFLRSKKQEFAQHQSRRGGGG